MPFNRYSPLYPLAGYILAILALFTFVLQRLPKFSPGATAGKGWKSNPSIFAVLAVVSLGSTWFYMLRFMAWSFQDYEHAHPITSGLATLPLLDRMARWVDRTALFEQAWRIVCTGYVNWWWSQQLCVFTAGAWTLYLFNEARRKDIKHVWAYMLLGQLVAISVAMNLFFFHVSLLPPTPKHTRTKPQRTVPIPVILCILVSLTTIALTPYTLDTPYFLPNLLLMHAPLVIPLVPPFFNSTSTIGLSSRTMYVVTCAVSALLRLWSTGEMVLAEGGVPGRAIGRFLVGTHPAQSSIGWDVVWTSVSFIVWRHLTTTSLVPAGGQVVTGGDKTLKTTSKPRGGATAREEEPESASTKADIVLGVFLVSIGPCASAWLGSDEDKPEEEGERGAGAVNREKKTS